ncbi:MAG: DUF983 domain-containing protein [Terrimonas sp.]|nr:DUF983 domain-containing protein [Terrimonas sp.]OJY79907.1 MAG: DUF983 domain-containing protein [Sphingobacteriales bacterium 40-81]
MDLIEITGVKSSAEKPMPAIMSIAKCKCPRCRQGNMFVDKNPYHLKHTMQMHETCPVCGQAFNLEVGFYYGSGYSSYAISIAVSVFSFVVYALTVGMSINDYRFLYWIIINAILLVALQPIIMRVARSMWLALFVSYDSNWRHNKADVPERTNDTQKNNW